MAADTIDVDSVFREHGPYAHRVLRRLGVPQSDVDDAFQEVFVVVHRRLGELEQRSSVRAWVYGICIRVASRYRRRRDQALAMVANQEAEPIDSTTPIECLDQKEAREALNVILDQLDNDKRAVFVLYEIEGLSMVEIAQSLGCPVPTAYSRLRAAREAVDQAVRRFHRARDFK